MYYFKSILSVFILLIGAQVHAQIIVGSPQYNSMKQNGTLSGQNIISVPTPVTPGVSTKPTGSNGIAKSGCQCYIQPDATYTVANFGGATDDGSQGPIALPFNFCLYGTNYTQFWLNINGNITFDQPYGTFSSVPFPSAQYVMVAPFWGDVDLGGTGTIYYKITPTAVYINWEAVGYFSSQTDKVNTFQLIITDGTDPVLPNGNNIAFCYSDMQWTTGSASGGVNGFGGTPATVGVNKGDGISFIQLGRFDQAGGLYDGPVGNNDGIDWLDNQSLYFNVCSSTNNISPIFSDFGIGGAGGVNGGNNCAGGDTLRICGVGDGDTLVLNPSFLAPESGQSVTVSANFNTLTGASITSSSPGNPGSAVVEIIGNTSNAGYHVIDFTGTDDGSPAQATTVSITIHVDTLTNVNLDPIILGDTLACNNTTLLLDSAFTYDFYEWNAQPSDSAIFIDSSGSYWITVVQSGCIKSEFVDVLVVPTPTPVITGNNFTCPNDSVLQTIDIANSIGLPYDSLNWGNGFGTNMSQYWQPGTNTLTVQDTNGCTASISLTIFSSTPLNIYSNTISSCNTLTSSFPSNVNSGVTGGNWSVISSPVGSNTLFSPNNTVLTPIITVDTYGLYQFQYIDLCGDIDTAYFEFNRDPVIALSDTFFCAETFPAYVLDADSVNGTGLFNYLWSTGDTTETISVTDTGSYTVTVSNACGTVSASSEVSAVSIKFPNDTSVCGVAYTFPYNAVDAPQGGTWSYAAGTPIDTVTFLPSNGTENPLINVTNYGVYDLTFTDSLCGIVKNMTVEFRVFAYTQIFDDSVCLGNTYNINAFGAQNQSYSWNTGSNASNIDVTSTGTYEVTVSNSCNTYTDSANITFFVCECDIPNAISPSNNGLNDVLYIDCIEYIEQGQLQVYNRWGTLVYSNENYDNTWNGVNNNGTNLEDGTYFYIFTIVDNQKSYKGTVNIFNN